MIGDNDGHTTEDIELSVNNPYIEKYCKLLDKLKPTKGYWGISFEKHKIYGNYTEGRLTKDEYIFLREIMFPENDWDDFDEDEKAENYFKTAEEFEYVYELNEGIRSETEYSFLTFQGYKLFYYDENGKKNKTKFVN